jgi:DNA processing protein
MDKELSSTLAILHSAGLTQKDLRKIWSWWGSFTLFAEKLLCWDSHIAPWISGERFAKIISRFWDTDTDHIEKTLKEKSISIITFQDESYPKRLRTIRNAPYILYVRWKLEEKKLMLGIVWSRKSTSYGKKILESIIPSLVSIDSGIVSGWAYGIDAISHDITLKHGWYTVSVFGCWVDVAYPPQNTSLFEMIIATWWALVSIFPIGTEPEPYLFPIRNEIVAALSDGIIIPEAWIKSGTLITANLALEHGRDVFAFPGDIFRETSAGTNMLIWTGQAKSITWPEGILEEYFPAVAQSSLVINEQKTFDSEEQKDIYEAIKDGYTTPDLIWQNTKHSIDVIVMTLSLLEIDCHIKLGNSGSYEII